MTLATGLWPQLASMWTQWIWPLMEFVIGLGLVVFVHELGHFLVAKAVGIKVERFALGFGPRLLGFQGGETEYSIRLLPLGGYIRMTGQDDFRPGKVIAEEDPRSYNAKSVGARMAVVSAGVVMNAILALVLFVVIAMVGRDVPVPVLGDVRKHYPASQVDITWQEAPTSAPATQPVVTTGLQLGDRIRRIDGTGVMLSILDSEVSGFDQLAMLSIMADEDEKFTITVEREVDGKTWVGTGEMGVRMGPSEVPGGHRLSFGISPAADTVVHRGLKYTATKAVDPFEQDDRVVAVCGKAVHDVWEIDAILRAAGGTTVPVTVHRGGKDVQLTAPRVLQLKGRCLYLTDGTKLDGDDYSVEEGPEDDAGKVVLKSLVDGKKTTYAAESLIVARRDLILDLLGMTPRLRVTGIVVDSPAAEAKLQPGDLVVHYGDTPLPTLAQLRNVSNKATAEGTQIAVDRGGKRIESIHIVPRREDGNALIGVCRHLDLAGNVVAGVRPGSPAARAGIESGYVIDKINDTPVKSWLGLFDALRGLQGKEIALTVRPNSRPDTQPKTLPLGRLDQAAFDADDYELTIFPGPQLGFLAPKQVTIRKDDLGEAITHSARQTAVYIISTYATIRSLVRKTVSTKDVMGPVGIGGHAIAAARADIMHLVFFMAYLSTILAVINFLPFPVVDGGHAAFLILEKIRGKPLSIRVMNVIQMAGLALIALLFLAVTYQDIMRYLGG